MKDKNLKNDTEQNVGFAEPIIDYATMVHPFIIKSDYEEILEQIKSISDRLESASIKLIELKDKFHVKRNGDELDKSYKIVFNNGDKYEQDEHTRLIFSHFVERYSLDITMDLRDLRILKNTIEAKLMRGKPYYCEVDLLSKEKKEPIEC